MLSTMQGGQLGVPLLLRHMQRVVGRSRVYAPDNAEGTSFAMLAERAGRLANALTGLGVASDAVVGTLCGSTEAHIEAYLGIPGSGRILHTINVRLHDNQIEYVVNHAGDQAVIVDIAYLDSVLRGLDRCPNVKWVIVTGAADGDLPDVAGCRLCSYDSLLAAAEPQAEWPDLDENSAAVICYTGGTTGMPKGVAYSHRSLWLQAASLCAANSLAIGSSTRVLPAVPLYHVNGWGIPYAALMAGADVILPSKSLQAKDLLALIDRHEPNLAAGVPTIWSDVLEELRARGRTSLGSVRSISCGGAQVPSVLAQAYAAMGVEIFQAWGMTETSSMSAIARIPPWAVSDKEKEHYRTKQGRVVCGLEARVVEIGGGELACDGKTVGEIQIRGPWVTASYLGSDDRENFDDGWLRTGDLGTIDADGHLSLSDRAKDAIKSGGEWIPSLSLEEKILAHPAIEEVAVVAVEDARWQERPAAIVVLKIGVTITGDELSGWLENHVPRWWLPKLWAVASQLPRTSVGKIDKKLIRQMIGEGAFASVDPLRKKTSSRSPRSAPKALAAR